MNEFEQYKERLQKHEKIISVWRKKVEDILSYKNLSPVMNNTKWIELQTAVATLPFLPPFIVKCVTDKDDSLVGRLDDAPTWIGDWSNFWDEGLPPFFDIEWIKVRPRYGKFRGRLVPNEVLDETSEFIAILKNLSIPYENENGTIIIYGYK